ncbi:MAG: hypothetical protein MI739_07020 [Bacteroidales bacterium]|nr:hypothetical protein [Bacteroidales bacterium]
MRRKTLLVFVFVCFITSTYAQIEKEISTFVDSTELLINNGRKFLLQKINENNIEKTKEVYTYLLELGIKKKCNTFSYIEELYINALIADWDKWLELAKITTYEQRSFCVEIDYTLVNTLWQKFTKNVDVLLYSSEKLTIEERSIIDLFLFSLTKKDTDKDEKMYKQKIKDFKSEFKNSKYNYFLNRVLPSPKIKGSYSFSIGPNFIILDSKLKTNFESTACFAMAMDFAVNKVYCSLNFSGGNFELKKPFNAQVDRENVLLDKGEHFSYFEGGLNCGYFLLRNKHFHVAPFVTLAGASLKSNIFDSNENKEKDELKIFNSFTYGLGLHTEVKIKEWNIKNFYGNYNEYSYISLKVNIGYNIISYYKDNNFKGNTFFVSPTLVWGFGNF